MKHTAPILFALLLISCSGEDATDTNETVDTNTTVTDETTEPKKTRKSPRMNESFEMDEFTVTIDYGSPRVRDRVIWGELVPYDKVWRAGADEATAITFDKNVAVGSNHDFVLAGTYGLYIIPRENADWTVILNEEWSKDLHDVWGAYDYKEEKDVLRFTVHPESRTSSLEEMTYRMEGSLFIFEWDTIQFSFPIEYHAPA